MNSKTGHNSPLLSVVMITYGHAQFISEALNGIFMQECNFKFELIIADDLSPDNTEEIVGSLLNKSPENCDVRYYRNKKNKGVTDNFLFALSEIKGEFVAFCEGDDYWTDPLKLQKQVDFLSEHHEFVSSFHACRVIDTNGETIQESEHFKKTDRTKEELQTGAFVPLRSLCYRAKEIKIPNEMHDARLPDKFLSSVLGMYGKAHFDKNIKPSCYRIHDGGVWSSVAKFKRTEMAFETTLLLQRYYNRINAKNISERIKIQLRTLGHRLVNEKIKHDGKRKTMSFILFNYGTFRRFLSVKDYIQILKHAIVYK